MTYQYAFIQVIFGSGILELGFYSGKIRSDGNQISFKMGTVRFRFEVSIFCSLQVDSLQIGFKLARVISDVGHFSSCYNSGFVRLWISLLRVFGPK